MKRNVFFGIFIILVAIMTSCATKQPLTPTVISAVGSDNQGKSNLYNFQYYLVPQLTLQRMDAVGGGEVVGGIGQVQTRNIRNKIVFRGNIPGILYSIVDNDRIRISFEEEDSLLFRRDPNTRRNPQWFKLLDVESVGNQYFINYGGIRYQIIGYNSNYPPYLMIKMQQRHREESNSRRVQGMTIQ